MPPLLLPFQLILLTFSGWLNRHQLDVIEYLQEENRVLEALWSANIRRRGRPVRHDGSFVSTVA